MQSLPNAIVFINYIAEREKNMVNSGDLEIDVTIVAEEETTPRELENLRLSFCSQMERDLSGDNVKIYQGSASRSVDPSVIGTVSLVLLPIIVEKVADIIIEWLKRHQECSITLNVPIRGNGTVVITCDPRTPPTKLKEWIHSAVETAQLPKK